MNSIAAPADIDHDRMPDEWEIDHGLLPGNAVDRNDTALDTLDTNL